MVQHHNNWINRFKNSELIFCIFVLCVCPHFDSFVLSGGEPSPKRPRASVPDMKYSSTMMQEELEESLGKIPSKDQWKTAASAPSGL